MKTKLLLSLTVSGLALALAGCSKSDPHDPHAGHDHSQPAAAKPAAPASDIEYYVCPMHPSVRSTKPKDTCPICKMDLVAVRKKTTVTGEEGVVSAPIVEIGLARLQHIGVRTEPVVKQELSRIAEATAMVRYDESRITDVNLRVGGWITKLFVSRTGDWVKQGDPLFTLYSPELLAAQRDYLIALDASERLNDPSLRASAREKLLLWDIPAEDIDALAASREPKTHFTFKAARAGYVIEKMALEGMKVEPGMMLYRLADLSVVWVEPDFYESELPLLKTGDFAEITFAGLPNEEFLGTVTYIYPFFERETRTQRARIEIQNPGGRLKPGMYARVALELDLGEHLSVPVSAVMPTGKHNLVFVHRGDGRIEPRSVTLGQRAGDYYAVVSGLKEEEHVITSANFLIDSESRLQGALKQFEGELPGGHAH